MLKRKSRKFRPSLSVPRAHARRRAAAWAARTTEAQPNESDHGPGANRGRCLLSSALSCDPLGLAQSAKHIAAGELGEIAIAPAAAHQLDEQVRIIFDAIEPFREPRHAVIVRSDADIVAAGDTSDVLDVIGDNANIDGGTRIGLDPSGDACCYGRRISWVEGS